MTDYPIDMQMLVDPLNPENVVRDGDVYLYDPSDLAGVSPIAIKDPSGLPLTNPLKSNAYGFTQPCIVTIPRVKWKSGTFEGFFYSYDGLRNEAIAAKVAAQDSATAASNSAALVGAPADAAIAAAVNGTGATKEALDATYVGATAVKTPTMSLNDAVAKAIAAGGGDVVIPAGVTVGLGADLDIPNNVSVVGRGAEFTKIWAPGKIIRFVGGVSRSISAPLSGVALDGVALVVGDTINDHARGLTLRDVMIENVTTGAGLTVRNNAVYPRFENIRIRNCLVGIKHDFSSVAQNSGANISYTNIAVHDCSDAGFWQDGTAADGWHVSFVNSDLEHNGTSFRLTSVGDGVLDITNGHYELNSSSYIQADSGNIWINGAWMFDLLSTSASKVAYFDLSGGAVVRIPSGRIQWGDNANNSLLKMTGSSRLIINPDMVGSSHLGPVVGNLGINPTEQVGTRGFELTKGAVPTTGQTVTVAPAHGQSAALLGSQPWDASNYELTAHLSIASPGADNTLVLFLNPGGVAHVFPIPTAATWASLRMTWTLGKVFTVIDFSDGSRLSDAKTVTHALSDQRTIDMRVDGSGTAAITAQNMIARVI